MTSHGTYRRNGSADSISIIIPTLNEERVIGETLCGLDGSDIAEIIVVDGGSEDATVEIAMAAGTRVLRERANRGRQQNAGAAHASGDILLFLHADTSLPRGFECQVRETLSGVRVCAGAFRFGTDQGGWRMRVVEWMVDLRSRLIELPYGDQAIFLRTETFRGLGGFAEIPLMEDLDLVRRLKRVGRVALADGTAVTSARRWKQEGFLRLTWTHQLCILGYYLGVRLDRLAHLRRTAG